MLQEKLQQEADAVEKICEKYAVQLRDLKTRHDLLSKNLIRSLEEKKIEHLRKGVGL